MVKIRLRRIGAKGRPYYRVVVAPSSAARNGRFVETIGHYDPVSQPKKLEINEERALHWLNLGAQPSETTAYLLNKLGILPKYLESRPEKRKEFKFLDRRTAAISKKSVVDPAIVAPAAKQPKEAAAVVQEPEMVEATVEEAVAQTAETPLEEVAVTEEAAPEVVEEPQATKETEE